MVAYFILGCVIIGLLLVIWGQMTEVRRAHAQAAADRVVQSNRWSGMLLAAENRYSDIAAKYTALVESYCRSEGKVYIPPFNDQPTPQLPRAPSLFRFKPYAQLEREHEAEVAKQEAEAGRPRSPQGKGAK